MQELLERSARFIDEGIDERVGAKNPTGLRLHELADGVALVESFSHVTALRTGEGLCVFDTATAVFGAPRVVPVLRQWSTDPVAAIVYTHGHVDHVGGARAFVDAAAGAGHRPPVVIGHRDVGARFDRYDLTSGYNAYVNARQLAQRASMGMVGADAAGGPVWPTDWVRPGVVFDDRHEVSLGDVRIELHHAKGETDDHA